MKKITIFFFFLFVQTFCSVTSDAQTTRPFELGFNIGTSWLQSDVKIGKLGSGGGFTFGRMYLENDVSPIDLGWRLRYLHAVAYGQDLGKSTGIANNSVFNGTNDSTLNYFDNTGYVYQNHKTDIYELSLEFVLGANKLREQTRIYPYIFGGAGLVKAIAKTNQLNNMNMRYNYDSIGGSGNSTTRTQLNNLYDGSYETTAEGSNNPKWKFMPSLGIGLGYQFSKGFSIGIEHKVTWALNDILDGQQWTNANSRSSNNDLYHYSSLWMKFSFGRKPKTPKQVNNTVPPPVDQTSHVTPPPAPQKPTVVITNPSTNPYTSGQKYMTITAQVKNINSRNDITFAANGLNTTNFTYDNNSQVFTYAATLATGTNSYVITATTPHGSDSKIATITYRESSSTASPPPIVTITTPAQNPYTTNQAASAISGTVQNVTSKNQIQLTFNGTINNNFTYTESSKTFSFNCNLVQGTNTIKVTATNSVGSDSKTQTIVYQKPVATPKPIVTITTPSSNPYTSPTSPVSVIATVLNVTSSSEISVKINGVSSSAFTFNSGTKQVSLNPSLNDGNNSIVITATNQGGEDSKTQTIIYRKPAATPKPVVTITSPAANPYTTSTSLILVTATVLNVTSSSEISVKINGVSSSAFTFNSGTKQVSLNPNLNAGNNSIIITATNQAGEDSKTQTIIYTPVTSKGGNGNSNLTQDSKDMVSTNVHTKISPPVVTITNPSTAVSNTSSFTYNVESTVLNVSGSNEIIVKVNGTTITNFNYNSQAKKVTFNATLVRGTNTITITGTNSVGTDSKTATINHVGS